MTRPLTVRSVVRTDFAQWLPLWEGYNKFYGRSGATAVPAEITQMTWARFLDAYEPMHALVAERDGELVGLTHYIFHRHTNMLGPICYLEDLFTAEAARGNGVGRAQISAGDAVMPVRLAALGLALVGRPERGRGVAERLQPDVAQRLPVAGDRLTHQDHGS